MFEINGVIHELKYNIKTIERIEVALGKSIIALLSESGGMLSMGHLKLCFAMALFNEDGNRVGQVQGLEIAEKLIITEGYRKVNEAVVVAIDRDCPFLFQVD